MKRINSKMLEEYINLNIRKADISREIGVQVDELYKLESDSIVTCKANNTITLVKRFIEGTVSSEWMHEWIDMIVFSDWYELYEYSNQEITDTMIDIHLYLDDEGEEALGFSIEDLIEKLEKLELLLDENRLRMQK